MEAGSDPNADVPVSRLPRITQLMALAIRFDDLIQNGEVTGYAELARLSHVSRARVTQIVNLLMLAPISKKKSCIRRVWWVAATRSICGNCNPSRWFRTGGNSGSCFSN